MTTNPKLPALTPAEVAALPDGRFVDGKGEDVKKYGEHFSYDHLDELVTASEVASNGGITARLVDPAPLEARLADLTELLWNISQDPSAGLSAEYQSQVEAALEGNDGA